MIITQPVVHDLPRIAVPTGLIIGTHDKTALGKAFAKPEVAASMGTTRSSENARGMRLLAPG